MTDAQSRTHRPRFIEHYSYTQVRVTFSSCSEASRFCKATNGSNFTIDPVAQSSHPTPQRDEHITRMLDQLSGGVGTFLQADGEKLVEFVRGLEQQLAALSQPAAGGVVGEARGTPALDVFTLRLFLKAADERCAVISKLAETQNSPHARSHIANYRERLRVANGQYEAARGEMLALIDRTSLRAAASPDDSRELALIEAIAALERLEKAFVIAVDDKSPFAKQALEPARTVLAAFNESRKR